MSDYKQKIGGHGEQMEAKYLEEKGMQVIAKNYSTKYGEIDLIAKDKNETVFVEVKTRKSFEYGLPQEAITPYKQKNLIKTSQIYLKENNLYETDWRIDVITVLLVLKEKPQIEHIKNAVTFF